MKAGSLLKKKKPAGLMLTSLLDMFTIILIFLIVSFEAEDMEFKLNENLTLPESSARSVFKPAVNIAITPKGLEVEQKPLMPLTKGRLPESYYSDGSVPELVEKLKPVYDRLEAKAEYSEATEDSLEETAIIMVQADKNLDYQTLYLVLRSASEAGFHKYRLAIMKK